MPTIFRDGRTAIRWQCSEKAKDPEAWKTQSVEPETLGQFTGAYDRNGKEIYEGDIVFAKSAGEYKKCLVVYAEHSCNFILHTKIGPWYIHGELAGTWPVVGIGCIHYYPYNLNPVPVTEEWLNRLGFTIEERWPSGFGSDFYKNDRKVKVSMSNRHGIIISLDSSRNHVDDEYMIDFVHELQNIYQDLTGEKI